MQKSREMALRQRIVLCWRVNCEITLTFDSGYGYDFWKDTSMPDIYRCTFRGENLAEVERLWK
ncbi:hypothetical protein ABD76_03160 [Paenibacillus dendritiformis]|nr:hypothetical protein [Paenibacillus dendritiformis]